MADTYVRYHGAIRATAAWLVPEPEGDVEKKPAVYYSVHDASWPSEYGPGYCPYNGSAEIADLAPIIFAAWRQPCDACAHAHATGEPCDVETGGLADDRPGRGGLRVTFLCGCTGEGPVTPHPDLLVSDDPDDEVSESGRFVEIASVVRDVVHASYAAERGAA